MRSILPKSLLETLLKLYVCLIFSNLFVGLDVCFQRQVQGHSRHWVRN